MTAPAHPAMKLAAPSFLAGALLVLAGVVILRGIVPLEPTSLWAIALMVPGGGLILFGLTVRAAGRILAAAQAVPDEDRPGWDDDEDE